MCNSSEALMILKDVHDQLLEALGSVVSDCYLYGSYARGDYHSESDVDIAVILDMGLYDISVMHKLFGSIMSELSLKYNITVSIATISLDIFNKFSSVQPFYSNILKEGIRYE